MARRDVHLCGVDDPWPFGAELPDRVRLMGRDFVRARFRMWRAGVVAQYREAVPVNSLHVLVLDDGRYVIDHQDDFNPDQGNSIPHLFADFIPTRAGHFLVLGLVAAVAVVGYAFTQSD